MREKQTKAAHVASWSAGLIILSLVLLTSANIPSQARSANFRESVPTIAIRDSTTNSYETPEIAPQPKPPPSPEVEERGISQSLPQSTSATASATIIPSTVEQLSIYGSSVKGRPLEVVRLNEAGTRQNVTLVLVAGIHGDESNTVAFLNDLHNLIRLGRIQIPVGVSLYLIGLTQGA